MVGVIIGRFMPPHAGHLYLLDVARALVDRLYVLVCTLDREPIPGALRHQWVRELRPDVHAIHITDEIPEAARGQAGATAIWAATIRERLPEPVTHLFASEEYGWELAEHLAATFVPVDPSRRNIPVSASAIRDDPWGNWRFIPAIVRPYFLRHVAIVGAPKLARSLAEAFDSVVVQPYAAFLERMEAGRRAGGVEASGRPAPPDPQAVHRAGESALARHAREILFHEVATAADLAIASRLDGVVAHAGDHAAIRRVLAERGKGGNVAVLAPGEATPERLRAILGHPQHTL